MKDGLPISVIDKIGGTKRDPLWVEHGVNLQEDNVLAEAASPPAMGKHQFMFFMDSAKYQLEEKLKSLGLEPHFIPSATYPDEELYDQRAQEVGCDPDYNAWTGQENPVPVLDGMLRNFRSAGGHVSVGYEHQEDGEVMMHIVRCMDMRLALPLLHLDKDDGARRNLYGKAGSFRPKPFGLEYRSLSSVWVDKALSSFVYDTVADILENNENMEVPPEIREIIDTYNLPAARAVMKQHNIQEIN
jgi:hypothetical protein